jgi:V-type H+-transporting ATPase subunit E
MEDSEASNVLDSMIQFISNHGQEQAEQLEREADQEFTIECEKIIGSEKERLNKIFETRLEQEGVEMKIKKSAVLNKQRIKKMVERNKWAEESFKESQTKLQQRMSDNPDEYKEILKKLIVQGLIKLMEGKVKIM